MDKLSCSFSKLMNRGLKIIMPVLIAYSVILTIASYFLVTLYYANKDKTSYILLLILSLIITLAIGGFIFYGVKIINKCYIKNNNIRLIGILLLIGFLFRFLWICTVKTLPASDFSLIWDLAPNAFKGDYSAMQGTSYMGRFPHLIITMLYLGYIQILFPNPLFVVKFINVLLSIGSAYLIYLIIKEIFNEKYGLYALLIAIIYPAFIMYNSVTCSENIAMPFYILSIYIFIRVIKGSLNNNYLLLCGLALSFGNLFRMVGSVILVAYIIYLIIYKTKQKLISSLAKIIMAYILPLILISNILVSMKVSEYQLWNGSEPKITSVLKGTNILALGSWNEADAAIPEKYNYDKEKISEVSREIIKERLTGPPVIVVIAFYFIKYAVLWGSGDSLAYHWATLDSANTNKVAAYAYAVVPGTQLLFSIILILMYIGLYDKKRNKELDLSYLIYGGFIILYLITEKQVRYGYIVSFSFLICAFKGVEVLSMRQKNKLVSKENIELNKEGNIEV
ncbi:glycosyltransferase family 39 protein [Clostridium gasigenes]|uniref:glycosyltransferase family 39 protein n=1 Tax=Clostridium gasigenes TaxID=94869 RepID=UPI00143830BE|nr:glycosyltransferase family 39 protein [Clostridium gasigenes]MBU3132111.1 glycosyltransferase family 39 protein [Clostridium gasigenes]NKF06973.1 glycosyltransferase family 39 protein [Clostridium gasigenes]QSW19768.1 glycosyltransferase family 39 protein [Clostridium gasigenes]